LLLACGVAGAQVNDAKNKPPPDPFAAVGAEPEGWERGAYPGAAARYSETLGILKRRIEESPADIEALEWAHDLLVRMNRQTQLTPVVFAASAVKGLDEERAGAIRGLLGHLLLARANELGWEGGGFVVIIGGRGGQRIRGMERSKEAIKLLNEAEPHLRASLKANPDDLRAMGDLIEVLEGIDGEKHGDEISKLRVERAAATQHETPIFRLPEVQMDVRVNDLRQQAQVLEMRRNDPDHEAALPLRREALVLEFCSRTIPFEYRASLYPPVSLLAPESMVQRNLTRHYTKLSGENDSVRVQYYPPGEERRLGVIRGLATDPSDCATATMLAVLRRATADGPVEQAAIAALTRNERPALTNYLPALLSIAIHNRQEGHYPPIGQRLLVQLVGALRLGTASPVLVAAAQQRPRFDLYQPRGILEAIGKLGRPEDSEMLLGIARDPKRDVYFRRRAIDALSEMGAELPAELDDDPLLAVSVAAARYRREPTEALRGRILNFLDDEHQADDAAAYCVVLGIKEALPLIEAQAGQRREHYSGPLLAEAYVDLQK
jgi:hypothetical protein